MEFAKLTATTLGRTLHFTVRPGVSLTVGRSSRCTACLKDPKVSREHCRVDLVGGKLRVTDLASSHGLTFRGVRVPEFEIEVGDGFHVGQTYMRFEGIATGPDVAPAPAVEAPRAAPAAPPGEVALADDPSDDDEYVDDVDVDDDVDDEPEHGPVDVAAQYPTVGGSARPVRRRKQRRGSFALRLFGQLCLIVTVVITTVAVLLAMKHHNPEWDVYRLIELLRPPK